MVGGCFPLAKKKKMAMAAVRVRMRRILSPTPLFDKPFNWCGCLSIDIFVVLILLEELNFCLTTNPNTGNVPLRSRPSRPLARLEG